MRIWTPNFQTFSVVSSLQGLTEGRQLSSHLVVFLFGYNLLCCTFLTTEGEESIFFLLRSGPLVAGARTYSCPYVLLVGYLTSFLLGYESHTYGPPDRCHILSI